MERAAERCPEAVNKMRADMTVLFPWHALPPSWPRPVTQSFQIPSLLWAYDVADHPAPPSFQHLRKIISHRNSFSFHSIYFFCAKLHLFIPFPHITSLVQPDHLLEELFARQCSRHSTDSKIFLSERSRYAKYFSEYEIPLLLIVRLIDCQPKSEWCCLYVRLLLRKRSQVFYTVTNMWIYSFISTYTSGIRRSFSKYCHYKNILRKKKREVWWKSIILVKTIRIIWFLLQS